MAYQAELKHQLPYNFYHKEPAKLGQQSQECRQK
jgi:hypothetical protein